MKGLATCLSWVFGLMCVVAFGQTEGDTLAVPVSPDTLGSTDTVPHDIAMDWEAQWAEWCATAHCVSSDSSLWNVPDVGLTRVGDHLDSAFVAEKLTALNVLSELDLRWNPVAHRGSKRLSWCKSKGTSGDEFDAGCVCKLAAMKTT